MGAGTFQPVKAETMDGHDMHAEFIEVSRSFMQQLIHHQQQLYAVGTTSLRTLESIYWLGVKAIEGKLNLQDGIKQWEVYDELPQHHSREMSLKALLSWMDEQHIDKIVTRTQILIAPGYKVRMINGLITNFHQPSSTLLLLVAALIGSDWKHVYEEAIQRKFRFLSYGDGMLIRIQQASV
ncbi:MAG: S-adenosylmethionine:tRNA ribosyltransferase-isomerase [Chitinophagaceae bacterium]|nr:S-adenosylmethionine:tRNA ribosyltransferase-isomerase [Chitinophagaceae bacterium]